MSFCLNEFVFIITFLSFLNDFISSISILVLLFNIVHLCLVVFFSMEDKHNRLQSVFHGQLGKLKILVTLERGVLKWKWKWKLVRIETGLIYNVYTSQPRNFRFWKVFLILIKWLLITLSLTSSILGEYFHFLPLELLISLSLATRIAWINSITIGQSDSYIIDWNTCAGLESISFESRLTYASIWTNSVATFSIVMTRAVHFARIDFLHPYNTFIHVCGRRKIGYNMNQASYARIYLHHVVQFLCFKGFSPGSPIFPPQKSTS